MNGKQLIATLAKDYNSRYLTGEEQQLLLESLRLAENFSTPVDSTLVFDKIAHIISLDHKKFPWMEFADNFGHRGAYADPIESIARDLILIEHIQKILNSEENTHIDDKMYSNTLDKTASEIAQLIENQKNFIPGVDEFTH